MSVLLRPAFCLSRCFRVHKGRLCQTLRSRIMYALYRLMIFSESNECSVSATGHAKHEHIPQSRHQFYVELVRVIHKILNMISLRSVRIIKWVVQCLKSIWPFDLAVCPTCRSEFTSYCVGTVSQRILTHRLIAHWATKFFLQMDYFLLVYYLPNHAWLPWWMTVVLMVSQELKLDVVDEKLCNYCTLITKQRFWSLTAVNGSSWATYRYLKTWWAGELNQQSVHEKKKQNS